MLEVDETPARPLQEMYLQHGVRVQTSCSAQGGGDRYDGGQASRASVTGVGQGSVCGVCLQKMGWGITILRLWTLRRGHDIEGRKGSEQGDGWQQLTGHLQDVFRHLLPVGQCQSAGQRTGNVTLLCLEEIDTGYNALGCS